MHFQVFIPSLKEFSRLIADILPLFASNTIKKIENIFEGYYCHSCNYLESLAEICHLIIHPRHSVQISSSRHTTLLPTPIRPLLALLKAGCDARLIQSRCRLVLQPIKFIKFIIEEQ